MSTFQRILFPIDFSPRCSETTCFVADVARSFGGELTLLNVFNNFDALELGVHSRSCEQDALDCLIKQRESEIRQFGLHCFDGIPTHWVVKTGSPADCITSYAQSHGIQLIIMPTHGRGRFRRLLAGSVTLKVLHDSTCPVWTTAHSDTLPELHARTAHRIVCAVDICPESVDVMQASAELARTYAASVDLVHAIPAAETAAGNRVDATFAHFLFEAAQERIAADQQKAGTSFPVHVLSGKITDVVQSMVKELDADFVVIGRGHLRDHFGQFWSHAGGIIHNVPCPVLSV